MNAIENNLKIITALFILHLYRNLTSLSLISKLQDYWGRDA